MTRLFFYAGLLRNTLKSTGKCEAAPGSENYPFGRYRRKEFLRRLLLEFASRVIFAGGADWRAKPHTLVFG